MAKKNSDFVDFHALFSQYRRRWYMFAISLAACLLLAFIYIKRTPEEYSVKANVLISQQKDAITAVSIQKHRPPEKMANGGFGVVV